MRTAIFLAIVCLAASAQATAADLLGNNGSGLTPMTELPTGGIAANNCYTENVLAGVNHFKKSGNGKNGFDCSSTGVTGYPIACQTGYYLKAFGQSNATWISPPVKYCTSQNIYYNITCCMP